LQFANGSANDAFRFFLVDCTIMRKQVHHSLQAPSAGRATEWRTAVQPASAGRSAGRTAKGAAATLPRASKPMRRRSSRPRLRVPSLASLPFLPCRTRLVAGSRAPRRRPKPYALQVWRAGSLELAIHESIIGRGQVFRSAGRAVCFVRGPNPRVGLLDRSNLRVGRGPPPPPPPTPPPMGF